MTIQEINDEFWREISWKRGERERIALRGILE
jgi:hypothetical protein